MLFGKVNETGYAPGETPESFRRVSRDTLEFVAINARSPARRKLATDEIDRRRRERPSDLVADAVKQGAGRWQAINRKLNGEVVWTDERVHPTKRAAVIAAAAELVA